MASREALYKPLHGLRLGNDAMKFGRVEAAVIQMNEIREERVDAFKARIRHLRNFNCPSIEKSPGGAPAEYSRINAVELAVALSLQVIGMPPKYSAQLATGWASGIVEQVDAAEASQYAKANYYLVILPGFNEVEEGNSLLSDFSELAQHYLDIYAITVVNVSKIVRDLDAALAEAAE